MPPRATLMLSAESHQHRKDNDHLPASFRIRRLVQFLMIIAKGRTRSSISTYVLIIRVFSRARVLFTFKSHASSSSGSHVLTMGTLAWGTQTTRSIPSAYLSASSHETGPPILTIRESLGKETNSLKFFHRRGDAYVHLYRQHLT